ncbi:MULTISPECIES: hypothetical protein [unclassified Streptomyces]|uniref:hypothetical protein n=1 Tax=unclassified Streptomyces TaxID=2593676 RepID=UPI00070BA78C|nr:hypothetical protein [Streptomyces sp. Root264]KRD00629.1 hypothetical protein ASE41_35935 [Streptomyces sp. Root264]
MSTGVIIALIVVVAAVVAVAAVLAVRARGSHGGRSLKHRFGPEYDRAVARHDGDVKAAERELDALVERHGGLRERPLEAAERERFEARWTTAQERFVDSPREAVAEADRLIAEVAGARGFPDAGQYEEQLAALSVHHAHRVDGYRRVHRVARSTAGVDGTRHADSADVPGTAGGHAPGTEDMRTAMVEARALFDDLIGPARHHTGHDRAAQPATRERSGSGHHLPRGFHRHQTKEG